MKKCTLLTLGFGILLSSVLPLNAQFETKAQGVPVAAFLDTQLYGFSKKGAIIVMLPDEKNTRVSTFITLHKLLILDKNATGFKDSGHNFVGYTITYDLPGYPRIRTQKGICYEPRTLANREGKKVTSVNLYFTPARPNLEYPVVQNLPWFDCKLYVTYK